MTDEKPDSYSPDDMGAPEYDIGPNDTASEVEDTARCRSCGRPTDYDMRGETRRRFVLHDDALDQDRTHTGKLCEGCWRTVVKRLTGMQRRS